MEEQDIQKEHNVPELSEGNSHKFIYIDVVYHFIWAMAFLLVVGGTNSEVCEEPVWVWGVFGKYFYLVNTVIHFISLFFLTHIFYKKMSIGFVATFIFLLIATLVRLSGIVFAIGIWVAFFHRDRCPDLNTLIIVQFVFGVIILAAVLGVMIYEAVFLFKQRHTIKEKMLDRAESRFMFMLEIALPIFRIHYRQKQQSEYLVI